MQDQDNYLLRIPIKEAIDSGSWFKCCGGPEGSNAYRLKILSFIKGKNDDQSNPGDGDIWLLNIEVVNVCKRSFDISGLIKKIFLTDQDGYRFSSVSFNFSSYTLNPKIKYIRIIKFLLPNDDELEYFINFKGKEV